MNLSAPYQMPATALQLSAEQRETVQLVMAPTKEEIAAELRALFGATQFDPRHSFGSTPLTRLSFEQLMRPAVRMASQMGCSLQETLDRLGKASKHMKMAERQCQRMGSL